MYVDCRAMAQASVSFFLFKQKTAYEMRISDWSSDVCSSDLDHDQQRLQQCPGQSDEGLLVADRDIPPRQDKEQLAVAPEVAPVLLLCAARFDDDGAHDYLFGVCARAERGAVGLGVVRLDSQRRMCGRWEERRVGKACVQYV